MTITMKPIGYIHSPFTMRGDTPKSTAEAREVKAEIVLDEAYLEGIADLKPGDRCMLLFYFHLSEEEKLTVHLRGTGPLTGVFSSHAPDRPNHIGVSAVTIEAVEGNRIAFSGVDMLDGTPVLDIKTWQNA